MRKLIALLLCVSLLLSLVVLAEDAQSGTTCATCGAADCHSTHVNWCSECRVDNCGKIHVPAPDFSEEGTAESLEGRLVKFNKSFPYLLDKPNGTEVWANASICPSVMRIVKVETDSKSRTLYLLEGVEGTFDSIYDGYRYALASEMELIEEAPAPLPPCEICGKPGCTAFHVFCDSCGKYDCGLPHDQVDNTPPNTPTIPENPTLDPTANVTLTDSYGKPLQGVSLPAGVKTSVSAFAAMGANVSYQWQVCYNNANDLWIDIHGATGQGLLISPAMFRSVVDAFGTTYLRCRAIGNSTMVYSAPIPVTLQEVAAGVPVEADFPVEELESITDSFQTSVAEIPALLAAEAEPAADDIKHAVTIRYQFTDGTIAADTVTLLISHGTNYPLSVESPAVKGYTPDIAVVQESIVNITGPRNFTVTYHPAQTDFVVEHYWQNLTNDNYVLHAVETNTSKLTGQEVGNNLAIDYEGFDAMLYDYTTPVAADGSTVIKIYYDRIYIMLRLDLNGGHGAEPMFARFGTPVTVADPEKKGYEFAGWQPELPAVLEEDDGKIHKATWTNGDAKYTIAFYHENANDTDYTFVGSIQKDGKTGTSVSANYSDYANSGVAGVDTTNFREQDGWTSDTQTVKADGSTVVNLYIKRRTYTLTYYWPLCTQHTHSGSCCTIVEHTHTGSCCNKQHTSHSSSCCILEPHTHDKDCCDLGGLFHWHVSTDPKPCNTAKCGGKKEHTHDTGSCSCNNYHDHSSGRQNSCNLAVCSNGGNSHTHGTGCNTDNCSHLKKINDDNPFACGCHAKPKEDTAAEWKEVSRYTVKYGAYVADKHAAAETNKGYRLTRGKYGDGGGLVSFYSMPDEDVAFYRISNGGSPFYVTYFLEATENGTGTRTYQGKEFIKDKTTFHNNMGYLGWGGDYIPGIPDGFKELDCTFSSTDNSKDAVDNLTTKLSDYEGKNDGSRVPYNNYYFLRKVFNVAYYNGETLLGTKTAKYEQPIRSDYNLTQAQAQALSGVTMVSPNGPGYKFAGWYRDAACTIPETFDGTSKMPNAGNEYATGIALYAKWEPIIRNMVVTVEGQTDLVIETPHGSAPAQAPADPEKDGYTFQGWFYMDGGVEKAYDFSMPVYRDMNLYPKYTSDTLASGYIYYKLADGTDIGSPTPISGSINATKTYAAKYGDQLDEAYRQGYFPQEPSHSITFSGNPDQDSFTFYYTQKDNVKYTILFVDSAHSDDRSYDKFPAINDDTRNVSVLYNVLTNNRTLDGWKVDAVEKEFFLSSNDSLNVFMFYYTEAPNAVTVQVEHHTKNAQTGKYQIVTTETREMTKGQTVNIQPLEIPGYQFVKDENNRVTLGDKVNAHLVKLYYDPLSYSYTFLYLDRATGATLHAEETSTAPYGTVLERTAPSIPGYRVETNSASITVDLDESKNVRTFWYNERQVTIRYQVGAMNGGTVSIPSETIGAVSGNPVGATATVTDSVHYSFTGWYSDFACTQLLTENFSYKPEKVDGLYTAATYYAGFAEVQVPVNYVVVGPTGCATLSPESEMVDIFTGAANGTDLTVNEGYRIVGWYDNAACTGTSLGQQTHFRPGLPNGGWGEGGKTYYVKIEEQTAVARFVAVGPGSVEPSSQSLNRVTGTVTAAATPLDYAQFVGWFDNEECTGTPVSTSTSHTFAAPGGLWPADGKTYYGQFKLSEFAVTFDLNGGTTEDPTAVTYRYGDTLAFPNAVNGVYVPTWTVKTTGGNWREAGKGVTASDLASGTLWGSVTLQANWDVQVVWLKEQPTLANYSDALIFHQQTFASTETITHPAANPTKGASGGYTYSFKEWVELDLTQFEAMNGGQKFLGYKVYYATYTPSAIEYTITMELEGGVLPTGTENPIRYNVETGAFTLPQPSKTGYEFKGWLGHGFNEETTSPNVSIRDGATGNYTFKAYWVPEEYNITYDLDDGTDPGNPVKYDYENGFTLMAPSREGYTFTGWTGTGLTEITKEVTVPDGSMGARSYTAHWSVNQYTVTLNGDAGIASITGAGTYDYGTEVTITATLNPGYEWVNWTGHETVSTLSYTFTVPARNVEYAANTQILTYEISYQLHGGTLKEGDVNPEEYQVTTPTFTLKNPEKPGYIFDGWNTAGNTIQTVEQGITDDLIFTALWKIQPYTITYNLDGGTVDPANPGEYTIESADIILAKPTKKGYEFLGWTGTGLSAAAMDVIIPTGSTGTREYTATWQIVEYTITLDPNNGTLPDGTVNPTKYDVTSGPISLPTPKRPGYEFKGWEGTELSGSATQVIIPTGSIGNRSYKAKWEETRVTINYVVKPNIKMGSVSRLDESVGKATGTALGAIAAAKDGYRFVGWYSDETCTQLLTEDAHFQPQKEQDSDIWQRDAYVFYAKFVPSHAYLAITANCAADPDQAFIYQVSGTADDGREVMFTVAVPAGQTVTVDPIPVGKYQVTQKPAWNWRYTAQSGTVEVSVGGENTIIFDYTTVIKNQWFNDYDRVRKGSGV